ncbi:hypothetical protein DM01DRAFT_174806 [Hesseltinella vesiculosa]|uniref:Uncharacterized protein n=1 Tax=Hesseltinella vesiculosa TaxID=101127 RepID=A0A1X2GLH4_9FUNG|nr:hypothetical protein DM01DRAFT_174806 [Hesseltinella vesiculosa]
MNTGLTPELSPPVRLLITRLHPPRAVSVRISRELVPRSLPFGLFAARMALDRSLVDRALAVRAAAAPATPVYAAHLPTTANASHTRTCRIVHASKPGPAAAMSAPHVIVTPVPAAFERVLLSVSTATAGTLFLAPSHLSNCPAEEDGDELSPAQRMTSADVLVFKLSFVGFIIASLVLGCPSLFFFFLS